MPGLPFPNWAEGSPEPGDSWPSRIGEFVGPGGPFEAGLGVIAPGATGGVAAARVLAPLIGAACAAALVAAWRSRFASLVIALPRVNSIDRVQFSHERVV